MEKWQQKHLNNLRQQRNFLLESMPKALDLAKRTSNKYIRSKSLSLYFDKKHRLQQIEEELKESC